MRSHLAAHSVDFADNKASALKLIKSGSYDLYFIDLKLGKDDDFSGLTLLPVIREHGGYAIVMSSSDDEETVNQAYALGCRDFYVKGNEAENVSAILAKYRQRDALKSADDIFASEFVTRDADTRQSVLEAFKYAATDIPLLLLGPSGTGKTLLARLLHERSGRKGAFVAINCSAYTEELLEAELFGYKKGAFTGAQDNRKGKLTQADNGTLFLDEIGSMSSSMQTKLLKAIEERSFYPVGSDKPEHSQFRIISATLENMQKLIADGKLRFDFFQRIHGYTVNLKPLCHRKDDIFPIILSLTKSTKRLSFAPDAKSFLLAHSWPGNIRELKKFVELISAEEGVITLSAAKKHLSQAIEGEGKPKTTEMMLSDAQYNYALKLGLSKTLGRIAWEIISRNLRENDGNKTRVRQQLKISTRILYSTIKCYGG